MRAVIIQTFGDPDGMAVVERPSPAPAGGEVVIRTDAIGVGGVDAVIRRAALGGLGPGFPEGMIPGSEVAGVITAAGSNVDPSWTGRRVWAFTGTSGGYAEEAVARAGDLIALPAALSPVDAVTLGSAAPVAHFAFARAHLQPGETVLVRGAGGSIGIASVQLAAQAGAGAVAVTTSSAERGKRLRSLGATHVLDRSGSGDKAPDAFDVILDIAGGPDLPAFISRLAPNGRLISVGIVGGPPPPDFGMAIFAAYQRSVSFGTLSLDTIDPAELARVRTAQFVAAARGDLQAVVHDVLPLEAAADAHRRMDAGEVFGRIVLTA